MLTILQPSEVPPGGFVFRDPETEFVIKHNNLQSLFSMAVNHRQANGLSLDEQSFINIVCASCGVGCAEDGSMPSLAVQAKNLISEVKHWAQTGFGIASPDEQARRFRICESCQHWRGSKGSGSHLRGRCAVCGCYGIKLTLASARCPLPEPRW